MDKTVIMGFVHWNIKLSHSGITGYKCFEGCNRYISQNSLRNLLKRNLNEFNKEMDQTEIDSNQNGAEEKKSNTRSLSPLQVRKCKRYAGKLAYYSATRKFTSQKKGNFSFKVAFITLTPPKETLPSQSLKAFEGFLDYLRRTANCVYVWKKEIGETGKILHYHILVNNFIPYYIVAWKFKRLLIETGLEWPKNEKGEDTSSHYRIELPRSKKQVNHYIAKYLSKGQELPVEYGYIWGKSKVLDDCKELLLDEGEYDWNECNIIIKKYKVIKNEFVKHVCVDLLKVKDLAPGLFALFERQYQDFCERITLTQKFSYI